MPTRTSNGRNGQVPTVGTDAIEILEHDHRTIEQLLTKLPDSAGAERTKLVARLKAVLTIHTATEENIVYPAIHELAGRPKHAEKLYHQQDDAKIALWKLDNMSADDTDFEVLAAKLRDDVLAHAQHEEQTEFPRLRELAGDQLDMLTSAVREFRSEFTFSKAA
jgi:hemerythrin superfamily protein